MDNKKFKKDLWWMLPLWLIAVVCLVFNFDPISDFLGKQNAKWVINGIGIIVFTIVFVFVFIRIKKTKK